MVVLTSANLAESKRIDEFCHRQSPPIAFIHAETRGVFASVFTDFGPNFTVFDVTGEDPRTGIVASVSANDPALVTCVEDERLEFQDGELVTFSEVVGMEELNTMGPIKVKGCRPHSFQLELDTTKGFGEYVRGGIVTQFKEAKKLQFKTLAEALVDPGEFLITDFAKFDRPPLLHLGFQALDAFEVQHGHAPRPANSTDASAFIALVKEINACSPESQRLEQLDEGVLTKMAHCAGGEINPMAAMFGGVVGQEVIKAISGKFHPIFQFLHFESLESLPSGDLLPAEEYEPTGTRYDSQILVMGRTMQAKLASLKLFLVGAGALGCEFLKNMAMMGIATGPNGLLTITDDDTIEKSNLSRQVGLLVEWNP